MSASNHLCDVCKEPILPIDHMVSAMTYGVVTHRDCFEALTGPQVLRLLYLDDVRMGPADAYDWDRSYFPSPDGSTERAQHAWAKREDMPGGRA